MSQQACVYRHSGDTIPHRPGSAVTAGQVIVLGTRLILIALSAIAAGALGEPAARGVFNVPKDSSDVSEGDAAYWDADGDPVDGTAGTGAFSTNPALGPFAGYFLEDAGVGVGDCDMHLQSIDGQAAVARSALVQDDLKPYALPLINARVWDAPQTVISAAANDDLGLVYNTLATASPSIETGDLKAANTTRYCYLQVAVPIEYVAGQTLTLRLNAGMKTTVSDTAATIDAQVYRQAAPTVDLCATAAQSINNLVAADKDFTITPTDVVPGDLLEVRLAMAVNDAATGTAVIGKLYRATLLADVKG